VIFYLLTDQLKHLQQARQPLVRPVDQLSNGSELHQEPYLRPIVCPFGERSKL